MRQSCAGVPTSLIGRYDHERTRNNPSLPVACKHPESYVYNGERCAFDPVPDLIGWEMPVPVAIILYTSLLSVALDEAIRGHKEKVLMLPVRNIVPAIQDFPDDGPCSAITAPTTNH